MPPLESGYNTKDASEQAKIAQERAKVCSESRQECLAHQGDMQATYPETAFSNVASTPQAETNLKQIPLSTDTIKYLTAKCAGNERLLTLAKEQAQVLLRDDPTILDEPNLASMFLDDCVGEAEIAAKTNVLETEKVTGQQLDTTIDVLSNEKEVFVKLNEITREEFKKGGSIDKKLAAIPARMADVPNNEVALAKINQAREMITAMRSVVTSPSEKIAFEQILSSNFVDLGADTMSVAFADVMDQVSTSDQFAPETKAKLDRLVWAKTGGQVNTALDAVDENGEPLHTEDNNPINVGHGTIAYTKPDGSRAARVTLPNGRTREMPWNRNESDDVIGTKISLAKIWEQNEWDGQTDFFGESIDIENDILSQTDPAKLRKVQQVINALLGGLRGYDAVIVQDNEASSIGWFNQFTSPKGDAMQRDFDKNTAVKNRTDLGFHPKGHPEAINYEVLRAATLFAKDQFGGGTPDYYALQQHLHDMFPAKNIPLTGENAPDEINEKISEEN